MFQTSYAICSSASVGGIAELAILASRCEVHKDLLDWALDRQFAEASAPLFEVLVGRPFTHGTGFRHVSAQMVLS